jgi:hypothetical protein
LNFFYPRDTR